MKKLTTVLSLLILLSACKRKDYVGVETFLKVETKKTLNKGDLEKLIQELDERLGQAGFTENNIRANSSHLTVKSNIESKDQAYYKSLFIPTRIGFYTTYKVTDEIIKGIDSRKIQPKDFVSYSNLQVSYFPEDVIGICSSEENLGAVKESILDSLQHVQTLKLAWDSEKWRGDNKNYLLYLLNKDENYSFNISKQTLASAKVGMNPSNGKMGVNCFFNKEGAQLIKKIMTKAFNEKRKFIVLYNDRVITAASVSALNFNGKLLIEDDFTTEEATTIAKQMMLKPLSFNLEIVTQKFEDRFEKQQ